MEKKTKKNLCRYTAIVACYIEIFGREPGCQAPPFSRYPQSIRIASRLLAFVSEWCPCRVNVCPLFLAECIWHLAALMFRTANLKTIGKAGTGW